MEISCEIIRDLLPLYAENMASAATNALVDRHLCGCDGCTKELAALKKAAVVPVDAEIHSLERVRRSIRRRRVLAVLCVVMTLASTIWSGAVFLTSPIYLTAEQAIEGVELRENGILAVDYAKGMMGRSGNTVGKKEERISVTSTRYDWYMGRRQDKELEGLTQEEIDSIIRELYQCGEVTQRERDRYNCVYTCVCYQNAQGQTRRLDAKMMNDGHFGEIWTEMLEDYELSEHDYDLWYAEPDGSNTLIWQGDDGVLRDTSQAIDLQSIADQFRAALWVFVVLAAASFAGAHLLRGKKLQEWVFALGALCASAAGALLVVTGGDFTDAMGSRAVQWDSYLVPVGVCMFLTVLLWRWLYQTGRGE